MEEPREVVIDGVRYVPDRSAVAGLDDLRRVLEDVFWGEGYDPNPGKRSEGLFVVVSDYPEGAPLDQLMGDLAAKLTRPA